LCYFVYLNCRSLFFLVSLASAAAFAQTPADTTQLPFEISEEKRLDPEDLEHKKEGNYITGLPNFSSDPINGFGYGVEGSLYVNGKRSDPFFAYTPYRCKFDVVLFNTTKLERELTLAMDIPYIFNSLWRLRAEVAYENNPNLLYFGQTESTLRTLTNPSTQERYSGYGAYEQSLVKPYENYNGYIKDEYILNMSAERSFMKSKMRALIGAEVARVKITSIDDSSLVTIDNSNKMILGVGANIVNILQAGLVYDTRDLETDPGSGIFAEVTNELSLKALGSAFNFNKTFLQGKFYVKVLPDVFQKMVFASRVGYGYTAGDAPFYEYQDQWSSEGSIEGLGGGNTLRGYKQGRFLGRSMAFVNLELRYRFAQTQFLKQHFTFSIVPFADAGGVWDNFALFPSWQNYRADAGLGFRIAWNVNTILRFDYAISAEDKQFFFTFDHAF
jgi:outer membrane protein assembly factor BamA